MDELGVGDINQENEGSPSKGDIDDEGLNEDNFKTKYHYLVKANAYAILRTHEKDFQISTKEAYLGRVTQKTNLHLPNLIQFTKSSKVSRKAAKLYLNEQTE